MAREDVGTVVIGGGQSGLAAGYYLHEARHSFVLLDEHRRVGDVWRNRWDSLRLFTPGRYDNLPGMPFPGRRSGYPGKDDIADYFEAYAHRFELPVRTDVKVNRLSRIGDRFLVTAGDDSWSAASVIVATGAFHHPRVPSFARELDDRITQLHSKEYRRPSQIRAGAVLVVGAANSGAEIALELAPGRRTLLSGRDPGHEPTRAGTIPDRIITPLLWFAATRVLAVTNPLGRKVRDHFLEPPRGIPLGRLRLKDLEARGIERVPRVAGVKDGVPVLENGRVLDVEAVVWCTGFAPDFSWIDLPLSFRSGFPITDRGVVQSCRGLYFLGLPFLHTLSSALVGGVGRDARHVVGHLLSTSATTPALPRQR